MINLFEVACFFRALSISSFKVRYFGRRQTVLFIKNQLKQVDKTFLIVDFLWFHYSITWIAVGSDITGNKSMDFIVSLAQYFHLTD